MIKPLAITIISGGMDSTVLAHYVKKTLGYDQILVSFHYNQKHLRELVCARQQADILGCEHRTIDLYLAGLQLKGSALTSDEIEVPEGRYDEDNMKATVIPNRNAIMLNMAYGLAISENADRVFCGIHSGDHQIYPDCLPEFISSLNETLVIANRGFGNPVLCIDAPFSYKTKAELVGIGLNLGVDFSKTWSCYQGRDKHCSKCGTCFERLEAFAANGIEDPVSHEDREWWKTYSLTNS